MPDIGFNPNRQNKMTKRPDLPCPNCKGREVLNKGDGKYLCKGCGTDISISFGK